MLRWRAWLTIHPMPVSTIASSGLHGVLNILMLVQCTPCKWRLGLQATFCTALSRRLLPIFKRVIVVWCVGEGDVTWQGVLGSRLVSRGLWRAFVCVCVCCVCIERGVVGWVLAAKAGVVDVSKFLWGGYCCLGGFEAIEWMAECKLLGNQIVRILCKVYLCSDFIIYAMLQP